MNDWTDKRIRSELAVCEAATPGPWEWDEYGIAGPCLGWVLSGRSGVRCDGDGTTTEATGQLAAAPGVADFIVAARTGYPDALKELLVLRRALELACAQVGQAADCFPCAAKSVCGEVQTRSDCRDEFAAWAIAQARQEVQS